MRRLTKQKIELPEVVVFMYFVFFSSLWVLAVNPFQWDRAGTAPWFLVGMFGVFIVMKVPKSIHTPWKKTLIMWVVSLGISLLYGTSVTYTSMYPLLLEGQFHPLTALRLFAPLIFLIVLVLVISYPKAALISTAVVFSCVGPAITLFLRPELTFGIGKFLQY